MINGIFLTRIVEDPTIRSVTQASFKAQFLIMLTTVMMLVYKAMHLRDFPAVWHEREQLLVEKRQLAERCKALSMTGPGSSVSDSGSNPTDDTATDDGIRDTETPPGAALLDGVVGDRARGQLGPTGSSQELSLEYDATSDRVAICLVELRSLPMPAGDRGSAQPPR